MVFSLEDDPETPIDTGYYHIEINANNCTITSINDENRNELNLFPNPAHDFINLGTKGGINSIEIFDYTGIGSVLNVNPNAQRIDISHLKSGIYFCKIETEAGALIVKKLIKL